MVALSFTAAAVYLDVQLLYADDLLESIRCTLTITGGPEQTHSIRS